MKGVRPMTGRNTFLLAAFLLFVVATCCGGCAWEYATEVPMHVDVQMLDATGQSQAVSVPCTGRIRYDRTGRIHIIGGIGPLAARREAAQK